MKAELDRINGKDVLRLDINGSVSRCTTVDLELTPEQRRKIDIHLAVMGRV